MAGPIKFGSTIEISIMQLVQILVLVGGGLWTIYAVYAVGEKAYTKASEVEMMHIKDNTAIKERLSRMEHRNKEFQQDIKKRLDRQNEKLNAILQKVK